MSITIKYFGLLTDITGKNEELYEFEYSTVSQLLESLYRKYPELRSKEFQVALDKELVDSEAQLTGSEIALLPPFSGG